MTIKTAAATPLRWGRHCLGAVRSLSPTAVIVVALALVVGGAGFADAATGGTFILGKANNETSTASLSNSKGTPLKLSAPAGVAPLAVSGTALVPNLNANYLGGLSAADLQPTGGDGFTPYNSSIPLGPLGSPTMVASTGALPAGTYYVTATALMQLPGGGGQGTCFLTTGSNPAGILATGGGSGFQQQAAETVAASVTAGDTLQESCETNDPNPGAVSVYAGITAIRILSSSGTTPATAGSRAPHHRPMRHDG
jgi:hypothetical protein